MRTMRCLALAGGVALAGGAMTQPPAPASAAAEALPVALAALQPGLWHLQVRDGSAEPSRDICLGDPRMLIQLRHANATCERFVAANEPRVATVSYTCPGAGGGRTSLRLSSPTAAQIDSQGIAEKAPFAFVVEARRTGDCPATPPPGERVAPTPAPAAPAR